MTLEQLDDFIKSGPHLLQVALTKHGAIALRKAIRAANQEAYEAGVASVDPAVFDLVGHLSVPSRDRPLAAAAAVNLRKGVQ